jgi:peptidoglycan-N-acetylglucosamine deacetylase
MRSSVSTRRSLALAALVPACIVTACGAGGVAPRPANPPPAVWGFTAPWDQRSDSSLRANSTRLDVAITGWIQLDSLTGRPALLYPDDPSLIAPPTTRLALVSSFHGQRFHPEAIRALVADTTSLARAAGRLADLTVRGSYRGVVLDLEGQSAADTTLSMRVVRAFADSVRNRGVSFIAMAVPAGDTAAYPSRPLMAVVDVLVVMLYDEHWSTSAPGPVATPLWVRRTLAQRVADVGASRIVAALPVYGYLWRGSDPATPVGFDDARRAAAQASVELTRDPASRSLHAVHAGSWDLWMSDAEHLRALRAEVNALGVTRIALWRLGLEDPTIWSVLPSR